MAAWSCRMQCASVAFVLAMIAVHGKPSDLPVSDVSMRRFNAARELQKTGDLLGAEREYLAAIADTPDFPHARTALADLLMDTGRAAEAEAMYLRVLRAHPASIAAANSLGFLHLQGGQIGKAIEQLSRVAALSPSATAFLNLGAAQRQAGQLVDAIASYKLAREADPTEPRGAYNLGNALYAHGDHSGAIAQYRDSLRLNPTHTDTLNNMANVLRDADDLAGSRSTLEHAVQIDPSNVAALCNLGGLYYDSSDLNNSLRVLDRAFALAPSVPEVVCSRANTLHRLNQTQEAIADYSRVVARFPHVQAYRRGLGEMLAEAGQVDAALRELQTALTLAEDKVGDVVAVLGALAAVHLKQGNASRAILLYRQAAAANPLDGRVQMNLGVVLADEGRLKEAVPVLRAALTLLPHDNLLLSNLGTVLHRIGEYHESAKLYTRALALTPASPNLRYNLANSLMDLGIQTDLSLLAYSVEEYTECLALDATYPGAMNNLGNALKEMDLFVPALRAWQTSLRLEGGRHPDVFSNMVHLRMFLCDWDHWDRRYAILQHILHQQLANTSSSSSRGALTLDSAGGRVSCQPFHALLYPHLQPPTVLAIARRFAQDVEQTTRHFPKHFAGPAPPPLPAAASGGAALRAGVLRIGYMSHDFGDHPTGHLFNSVPSLHTHRAAALAFYFTLKPPDESRYARRLVRDAGAARLVDLSPLSFEQAGGLINSKKLHVLIDLDVWMKGRRPEILALRPAPVQMVYLGYPGSSGAPYIDYMVADKVAAPPEMRELYSEKLLFLPFTYQVNDYKTSFSHARRLKANRRAEHRLPKDTTLLANFNQLYKIDPPTLDLWIRVFNATLARMPPGAREEGGVKLWLLKFPPAAAARLLAEADKRGLPQRKIVLSDRIDKEAHVERVQLADLFLDNHHVNAHTTASEALWQSVPLVTWPGAAFASRVAASLLLAAAPTTEHPQLRPAATTTAAAKRIPDTALLIARDADDFVDIASLLASKPGRRRRLRKQLHEDAMESPLFDTHRWVRAFESSLKMLVDALLLHQHQRVVAQDHHHQPLRLPHVSASTQAFRA